MPNTPINILVVDDDSRNLEVLESVLAMPLVVLIRAKTAEEALLALMDGEFAAIVLDVQLPGLTGIELAKLIKQRKRSQHIPILLLTAYYLDEKNVLEGYEAGAVEYLIKPVNPKILKSKIAVYVDLFRANRELSRLNQTLQKAERDLVKANSDLEMRVQERTAELTLANAAKDDFLAVLSHELRMPLNPALLLASESAEDPHVPERMRERFNAIARHIQLEARLIDDLLDLTRVAHGKISLDRKPVKVHEILKEALNTVQEEVRAKRLLVQCHFQAKQSTVQGDPVRLQQIFWNVIKNAVKFTPEDGRIEVITSSTSDQIEIRVTDTGIGMTESERERAFNAFAQGEHAKSKRHRFGGLGLGLSISSKLVELHSGIIQIESPGRGLGTAFTIKLPLTNEVEEVSKTFKTPPVLLDKPRLSILLVEDHEPTRSALMNLLIRRRHTVTAVGSAGEARKASIKQTFDLVLSDIGLPDESGYTLMAELRSKHGLQGIALTGYGMEHDIERSKEAGFIFHLTKPIHIAELERALLAVG